MKRILPLLLLLALPLVCLGQTAPTQDTVTTTLTNKTIIGTSNTLTNLPAAHIAAGQIPANVGALGFDTPLKENAVGDHVHDDNAAIRACVNTGACYLPAGYIFATSVPIQIPTGASLIGAGIQSGFFRVDGVCGAG